MRLSALLLGGLLAATSGAGRVEAQRVPYEDRPAYQRASFTAGAMIANVMPVVSALVAPKCLPGYVLCKVAFAGFSLVAAGEQLLLSGGGDMEQTRAILARGFGGDWYLTGRDVIGDHVPDPYPSPAAPRGDGSSGFEPPPL